MKPKWSSMVVPSVQELSKQINEVPQRYIRPQEEEEEAHHRHHHLHELPEIPVIDMNNLISQQSGPSELAKLHLACQQWGFFQLVNHGVSSSLMEKVKMEIQDLFNMPIEEKKKLWQSKEDLEGFGQAFVVSEDQKLDWADLFFITTLPTHTRKPHLFPYLPLPLRETLEAYSKELKNVAMVMIEQMGKALEMEVGEMRDLFEDGRQSMRMNYYPACPEPEKVIGITPHSDAVGLTILLQLNEVEGLQIRKDGMWVPVRPLPNAFILNIGDILQIISNGIYPSVEHRATVNSEKERLSVAAFYNPKYDAQIGPSPSLITQQTPPQFKTIGALDYFRGLFSRQLDGKSYLDSMRIHH